MGGAIDIPGNTSPSAEFNWWFDPESTKICLRTPFKEQIVVANDIAERVFFTKKQHDRIMNAPETPLTRMYKDLRGPGWKANPDKRSFVWDAITAAIFLRPEIITKMEERFIDIDTNMALIMEDPSGIMSPADDLLLTPENFPDGTQKVKVLKDIDRDAFFGISI